MKEVDIKHILVEGLRKSKTLTDFVDELPDDVLPSEVTIKLNYKHKNPNTAWKNQADKIGLSKEGEEK